MFSKLFKKYKKVEEVELPKKDTFSLAEMKEDGKTFLLRFKENQFHVAKSGRYPYQIGIATPLHSSCHLGGWFKFAPFLQSIL